MAEECKFSDWCSNAVPTEALSGVLGVSQMLSLVATGSALRLHYQQYMQGDIDGKQLVRKCVLSFAKWPGGVVGSTVGGAVSGATSLGAFFVFAQASPAVGAVSMIASMFGAYIGVKASDSVCETLVNGLFSKCFGVESEDKSKEKQIAQAFLYFQFNKNEIKTFKVNVEANKKILQSKYRNYARLYHPDRNGGSSEKFAELQMNYGILRAVLNCKLNDKEVCEIVRDSLQALMF